MVVAAVTLLGAAALSALAAPERTLALAIALGGAWAFGWHLVWQLKSLDIDEPDICLEIFRSNRNTGFIPALFFAAALFV